MRRRLPDVFGWAYYYVSVPDVAEGEFIDIDSNNVRGLLT